MKALTILQPYASLIMARLKRYETRSWRPGITSGEVLAIHAGAQWYSDTPLAVCNIATRNGVVWFPRGVILGTVKYVGIHSTNMVRDGLSADELQCGDFSDGRWAWEIAVVEVFDPPIPAKGKQRLWEWTRPEVPAP